MNFHLINKYYMQQKIMCLKFNGSLIASFLAMTWHTMCHCEERSNSKGAENKLYILLVNINSNHKIYVKVF